MNEKGIHINCESKDGKVIFGNEILTLKDKTCSTFKTISLIDFLAYCDPATDRIFYNENSLCAFAKTAPSYTDTKPKAECSIEKTAIAEFLVKCNNKKMELQAFEEVLIIIGKYLQGDAIKLLDILTNFTVSKVKTVSRLKDHQSNYSFKVASEKNGQQDYDFPKTIKIEIPIIETIGTKKELVFDFQFTWTETDDGPKLLFEIRNIDLAQIIREAIREVVSAHLLEKSFENKFGTFTVFPQTDKWQIERNDLVIKGM